MNEAAEPTPFPAPAPLADRLETLERLLEEEAYAELLADVDAGPPPFLALSAWAWRWHRCVGLAALRAGDADRAGLELLDAFLRRPDDLEVAAALVRLHADREAATLHEEEAAPLFALEQHHADALTLTSRSLVRFRLAQRMDAEDRPEQALLLHELAHADAPEHVGRARACLRATERCGRPERAFELRARLIEVVTEAEERAELCRAHAEALLTLDRRDEAFALFVRAVRDAPTPERLQEISDRLRSLEAGIPLVDVLGEAAAAAVDPKARRAAVDAMRVASEEAGEAALARAARMERHLDRHPEDLEVFETLTALLGGERAWTALEEAYTRMIERSAASGDERLLAVLWRTLAQLREQELERPEEALFAYRIAFQYDKAEEIQDAILRLSRDQESGEFPVDELEQAVQESPDRLDLQELLGQTLLREGELDHALLRLRTVVQRGGASRPSRAALRRLEQHRAPLLTREVPEELRWAHLRPEGDLAPLEPLFRLAGILLRDRFLNDEDAVGLRRADRIDEPDLLLCRRAGELAPAFGLREVRLFRHANIPGVVDPWFAKPTLLVAPELLSGVGDYELRFLLARAFTLMQPRFALVGRLRPAQLAVVLQGMLLAADPGNATASSDEALRLSRDVALRLDDETRALLERCAAPVLEERLDLRLEAWLRAVADEANRFGLLFADDLQDACIALGRVIPAGAGSALQARREAMIRWSSSRDHLALRDALGIAVRQQGARA